MFEVRGQHEETRRRIHKPKLLQADPMILESVCCVCLVEELRLQEDLTIGNRDHLLERRFERYFHG